MRSMRVTSLRSSATFPLARLPKSIRRSISGNTSSLTLPVSARVTQPLASGTELKENIADGTKEPLSFDFDRAADARFAASQPPPPPMLQAIHKQVNDRGCVKRQKLADDESADNGDAERTPQLRSGAMSKGKRNSAQQRGHGGHQNRTESQQTRFIDRFFRILS